MWTKASKPAVQDLKAGATEEETQAEKYARLRQRARTKVRVYTEDVSHEPDGDYGCARRVKLTIPVVVTMPLEYGDAALHRRIADLIDTIEDAVKQDAESALWEFDPDEATNGWEDAL